MATQYIEEFASLADLNLSAPKTPSAVPFAAVRTSGSQVFYPGKTAAGAQVNFELRTQNLSKTIRLNSQTDSDTTSGDLIGFQSKPRTGVAGTQNVYGCQISAQISNGIALTSSGSIIGGHFDVYLRGTSAGTIAGDVRGLQIELTSDDAGTRTISGYVTGLRIRMAFSAGTVTGIRSAIRVEKPEAQTGSETYDALFDLTGTIPLVWNNAPGTEPSTADGYIKVRINGANRYIQLYSTAPTD